MSSIWKINENKINLTAVTAKKLVDKCYDKVSKYSHKHEWNRPDSVSETLYWVRCDMICRTYEDTMNFYKWDKHFLTIKLDDTGSKEIEVFSDISEKRAKDILKLI